MPEDTGDHVSEIRRFLGGHILAWLAIGVVAAGVLAGVELAIALSLQLFLRSIGVLAATMDLPAWVPSGLGGFQLAMALVSAAVVRGLCQYLGQQSASHAQEGMNARLRRIALYRMIGRGDTQFVPAAEINAQLADTFPKTGNAASYAATFLASIMQTMMLGIFLLLTSLREALVGSVGLFAVGLIVVAINRAIRRRSNALPPQQRLINEGIERVARNFILVRILRTFSSEHARLVHAVDTFAHHSLAAARLGGLAYAATPFLGMLLLTILIVMSQTVFQTPGLQLVTFLYLFVRFVQALAGAVQMISFTSQNSAQITASWRFVQSMPAANVAAAVTLGTEKNQGSETILVADVQEEAPSLALKNVTFRYEGASRDVVSDFSLVVAAGEHLAIIGPSGSGKSTLLQLVLGLLRPQKGSVEVGGQSPQVHFGRANVRVGYVGAEAFLVAGTVKENLLYGNRARPTESELWGALESARMHTVVGDLPRGLDYELSENGQGLSAGQQQRLCLARALLYRPSLLILDEATANLDVRTEEEIADVVSALRGRCTTLIVSHRQGILKHVDRAIDLSALGTTS